MKTFDYMPEIDGPQSYVAPGGRRILCKGGGNGIIGAIVGAVAGYYTGGASTALMGAAAGGIVGSSVDQQQQADAALQQQKEASAKAQAQADKQATAAEQSFNAQNQKRADTTGALSAAQQAGKAGGASTMLTGPQGVDPSALTLGNNTLLGG